MFLIIEYYTSCEVSLSVIVDGPEIMLKNFSLLLPQ